MFLSNEKYSQKTNIMTSSLPIKNNLIKSENKIGNKQNKENIDLKSQENEKYSERIVN